MLFWTYPSLVTAQWLSNKNTLRDHGDHLDYDMEKHKFCPFYTFSNLGFHHLGGFIIHDCINPIQKPTKMAPE